MTDGQSTAPPSAPISAHTIEGPFITAPEKARSIFIVSLATACAPLAAGAMLFGWRAVAVAVLCIVSCATVERLYYRVSRVPALLGRSHAYLTGVMLALTLPPFVPWYIPVVASVFAIVVGKAVFGGVGHFLWQPALVGRLAVAVMFPAMLTAPTGSDTNAWPLLAQEHMLFGDVASVRRVDNYRDWKRRAPDGSDGFLVPRPVQQLRGLTLSATPTYSGIAYARTDLPDTPPAALEDLPPVNDLLYGARPGGIGETCAIIILVAGLYLVYRNYVKWQLPAAMILTAAAVAAIAPVKLVGPGNITETHWLPVILEGADVGLVYVSYQILSGPLLLAALLPAMETTSRPVTAGGQTLFGIGCGAGAMLLQLYVDTPIPAYLAVLGMNTFTPAIDALWRPRVLGTRRWTGRPRRKPTVKPDADA
ncbi:MAG: RnfABCDGE type electron transport complex subunit D [Phycisphaerae bacterium]